ncbi:MAG TPA: hypothetical protein VGF38_07640 [Ktedonobacterales bacterium]
MSAFASSTGAASVPVPSGYGFSGILHQRAVRAVVNPRRALMQGVDPALTHYPNLT